MNALKKIYSSLTLKEKKIFWGALGLAIASAAGIVILFLSRSTVIAPADGGTFTEGVVGQPALINPLTVAETDDATRALTRLLFSDLSTLSSKIENTDDAGRSWDVRLKEGIFWHDGQKITSDDVIFTISRIQDPKTASPLAGSFAGIRSTRVSELEVQFFVPSNAGFFREALEKLPVIPKHIYADIPSANWKLSDYSIKPVGSGPFLFQSFDKRSDGFISSYTLKRNEKYPEPRPHLSSFVVRFFTKSDDLIDAFNVGRVDAWMVADPDALQKVRRPYAATYFSFPGYYALFLNQGRSEALADASVRKAFAYAINKDAIKKDIFSDKANIQYGPVPAGSLYSDESAESSFSPDKANEILDAAGWEKGADGIRTKALRKNDSATLSFTITTPSIPFLTKTAERIKSDLSLIGAKVDIVTLPIEEIRETAIKNRDYDALLFGNILGTPGDMYAFWHSSQRFFPGQNLSLYANKSVDSCLEAAREASREKERERLVRTCAQTISGDFPAVFLVSPLYPYIVTNHAEGIRGGAILEAADRFAGVADWYVKTARVFK